MAIKFSSIPGLFRPGAARPADPGVVLVPPPVITTQWTFGDVGGFGPVEVPVANTNGSALVALVASGSDNGAGYLPRHSISDDAHNWWTFSGSANVILAGANRRVDVWVCPSSFPATVVSISASMVYAGICGAICQVSNFPAYAQLDFVAPTVSGQGTTATLSGTASTAGDFLIATMLFAGGNPGVITPPGGSWTTLTTENTGVLGNQDMANLTVTAGYEAVGASGAQSATWGWGNSVYFAGVMLGFKGSPTPPAQPNPNWPSMVVEAAFGYQPANLTGIMPTWTDLTSRCIDAEGSAILQAQRGRSFELTQPEAGTLQLLLRNDDGAFDPLNTSSPYYPNVLPEVPIRISCFWQGKQYGIGYYYANSWPQEFPDPQWGVTTLHAADALGIIAQGTLPSAYAGQVLADFPYSYYPLGEFYNSVHGVLFNNLSRSNTKPMIGYSPTQIPVADALVPGQTIGLAGDSATGVGVTGLTTTYSQEDLPGLWVRDNGLPNLNNPAGLTLECWLPANATVPLLTATPILSLYGVPLNYPLPAGQPNGQRATITYAGNTPALPANPTQNFQYGLFAPNGQTIVPLTGIVSTQGLVHCVLTIQFTGGNYNTTQYLNGQSQGTVVTAWGGAGPDVNMLSVGGLSPYSDPTLALSNYAIGQVAVYSWALPPARVLAHYSTGNAADNGDTVGARVGKLFTWSGLGIPFGVGGYSSEPNPLIGNADQIAGTALSDALYATSVDEGGMYYVPATSQGEVWYAPRQSFYNQPPLAIFGDNGTTEIPYDPASGFDFSDTYLYNITASQRTINAGTQTTLPTPANALKTAQTTPFNQTGADAVVSDAGSEAQYFPRGPLQLDIETTLDSDAYDRANWALNKYKQPQLRANQIAVNLANLFASNPTLAGSVLGLEQGDIVTVNRRPIGAAPYSVACIIQMIDHSEGPDLWHVTFTLAPYFPDGNVLQLDNAGFNTAGAAVGW